MTPPDSSAALASSAPVAPVPATEPTPAGGGVLVEFPTGRYAIPPEDMPELITLPIKEQERIKLVISFMARMEAGGVVATSENLGFQLRHIPGYSAGNLRALYYKWQAGGWRGLRRNYTNGHGGLPPEFITHFRALCENNGRSLRQAMNALRRAWHAGEAIPGYGTWREWFFAKWPELEIPAACPRTPEGWGKSNLYLLQPTKAQRALKSRGLATAKAHLLSIIRDPSRLLPLQLVVIDDFELDQLCVVRGHRQLCRMVGVAAMDVATRRILACVLKPRLEDDQGKQQAITRAEVRLLLFQLLREHGIPAHGMTILCEKAAAAVTGELQTTFLNLFGGRVAITRTTTLDGSVRGPEAGQPKSSTRLTNRELDAFFKRCLSAQKPDGFAEQLALDDQPLLRLRHATDPLLDLVKMAEHAREAYLGGIYANVQRKRVRKGAPLLPIAEMPDADLQLVVIALTHTVKHKLGAAHDHPRTGKGWKSRLAHDVGARRDFQPEPAPRTPKADLATEFHAPGGVEF
jgi:hypothetical protein